MSSTVWRAVADNERSRSRSTLTVSPSPDSSSNWVSPCSRSDASCSAEAEQLAAEREGGDTQFDEESGEGDTINIERERDLLLSASAQQIVDEIDRALERIENKTYGLCLPAGRRINLERLEALPYAETCVDCKARAERRR